MMKYIVIGGKSFRGYTGTLTFTDLNIVGITNEWTTATQMYRNKYEDCGGFLAIIATEKNILKYPND